MGAEDHDDLAERLVAACGLLPGWAEEASSQDCLTLQDYMDHVYAHGGGINQTEIAGGEVDGAGVFEYPGDPPLAPIAKITTRLWEHMYVYPHSIVSFSKKNGGYFVSRMD
jgi:hypothetical protein